MAQDFITATPNSTSGNGSISVAVAANSGAERNATVVVSHGDFLRCSIPIKQNRGRISVIAVTEYGSIENMVINT